MYARLVCLKKNVFGRAHVKVGHELLIRSGQTLKSSVVFMNDETQEASFRIAGVQPVLQLLQPGVEALVPALLPR